MAKKTAKGKTMPKALAPGRPPVQVTLRGSEEWKHWVQGLADHVRSDVAKVIDRALIDYARKEGYDPNAPSR